MSNCANEKHDNTNSPANDLAMLQVIGSRIRSTRESQCITQTQLATMIGTTQSMIGKYERGELDMGISRLIEISVALGIMDGRLIAECS